MIGAGKILTWALGFPVPLDTFSYSVRHPFRLRRGSADVIKFPSGLPLRQGAYAGSVISSHLLMLQRADV